MKTIIRFIFCCLLLVSARADGQRTETPAQKIRRLEEMEKTAITKGDTATLFTLWSEDYVVNNPDNKIVDAIQIKAFIKSGGIDYTSFTRNIEKITFVKDIAIVMGTEVVNPKNKSDNAGKTITRQYTNIWMKRDTTWQLCARQATNILLQ